MKFEITYGSLPKFLILLVSYIFLFFTYVGGFYNLAENPDLYYQSYGNPVYLYPSINRQFIHEGIAAGLLMFMGAFGVFYAISHKKSRSKITGVILFSMALVVLDRMIMCKLHYCGFFWSIFS